LESGKSKKETSRVHHLFQPFHNVTVMMGGKYTTFRRMAQELARSIFPRIGYSFYSHYSQQPLSQLSTFSPFGPVELTKDSLERCLQKELVRSFEDLMMRRLGLANAKHASNQNMEQDFFLQHLSLIQKYCPVTEHDIHQFFQKR
jgi:glycerol-3-phosphate dehydrogenase